jgi:hypothetical protein
MQHFSSAAICRVQQQQQQITADTDNTDQQQTVVSQPATANGSNLITLQQLMQNFFPYANPQAQ